MCGQLIPGLTLWVSPRDPVCRRLPPLGGHMSPSCPGTACVGTGKGVPSGPGPVLGRGTGAWPWLPGTVASPTKEPRAAQGLPVSLL